MTSHLRMRPGKGRKGKLTPIQKKKAAHLTVTASLPNKT